MTNRKKNILLIGSGKFIANTILPALCLLPDLYSIVGFVNRSGTLSQDITRLSSSITCYKSIASAIEQKQIDVIFLCVPQHAVIECLKELKQLKLTATPIFISTPIIPLSALKQVSVLKAFKDCYAFEFVPYLKPYQIAKQLVSKGVIGEPIKCWLNHSGYLYHGLATVKQLLKASTIKSSSSLRYGKYYEYTMTFEDNKQAQITEPKSYSEGTMLLAGTKGVISNSLSPLEGVRTIKTETDECGVLIGFSLNGAQIEGLSEDIERFNKDFKSLNMGSIDLHRQLSILAAKDVFLAFKQGIALMPCYTTTIEEHLDMRLTKKLSNVNRVIHWLKRFYMHIILNK